MFYEPPKSVHPKLTGADAHPSRQEIYDRVNVSYSYLTTADSGQSDGHRMTDTLAENLLGGGIENM